jgi:hypothetical protein
MTKYNTKIAGTAHEVVNAQGGQSIKLIPELELVGLLATGLDD